MMIFNNIRHRIKLWFNNIRIEYRFDVLIEKGVTRKYIDTIQLGKKCTLQAGVYLYGSRTGKKVILGDHVVVSAHGMIFGEAGVEIGDGTQFGSNVTLTTQYGDRQKTIPPHTTTLKYKKIKIGNGGWIGAGVVIMPGVVLGDNCAVMPNSVVYGIWGDNITLQGNPATKRNF